MPTKRSTQKSLILNYFRDHPNQDIPTKKIVDWATREWEARTDMKFRDPDRVIRTLYGEGKILKVSNGVYKYDPAKHCIEDALIDNFSELEKQEILMRDGKRCVVCGASEASGASLHIDHVRPRSKGGMSVVENGQVLCSEHNNLKKNYGQLEFGRRFFRKLRLDADSIGDQKMVDFADDVLRVYSKHAIDDEH